MEEFVISLEESQYPIDLLLSLVKEKKLDIRSISLASIADEFMDYVDNMNFVDLELMSDFIALASDLLKIKSLSLIPSTRKYAKRMEDKIKTSLQEREELLKKAREIVDFAKFIESVKPVKLGEKGKTITNPVVHNDFVKAFKNAKKRIEFREKLKYISNGKFSVSDSIKKMKELLSNEKIIKLLDFLNGKEKMEKISYIIAVLEIVKEDFAALNEDDKEIEIIKN